MLNLQARIPTGQIIWLQDQMEPSYDTAAQQDQSRACPPPFPLPPQHPQIKPNCSPSLPAQMHASRSGVPPPHQDTQIRVGLSGPPQLDSANRWFCNCPPSRATKRLGTTDVTNLIIQFQQNIETNLIYQFDCDLIVAIQM